MAAARVAIAACTIACFVSHARADEAGAPAPSPAQVAAASEPSFGATAHVAPEPNPEPAATQLDQNELRTLRSSFGESFNPGDAVAGVVPVFSGVPYMLVRGAPPAGTAQYYDGIPVPSLFHLALGPLITHPALVGELRLYPGVAPARYGRHTGAVFVADPPHENETGHELELRLLDAQGLVRREQHALALHARVGYPQLMLAAIGSNAKLSYWDYEARYQAALSSYDELTLTALGAGDGIGERSNPGDDIELQFHRWLARITRTLPGFELGSSIYLGYEQGLLGQELSARSGRLGPALWVELKRPGGTRLRVGADMEARLNRLRRGPGSAQNMIAMQPGQNSDPGSLPNLSNDLSLQSGPADFVNRAPLARIAERNAFGAYAELGLQPLERFEVETGVRADTWLTAGRAQHSTDQRALVRWHAARGLVLHAGAGTVHQIASSPLPIPGLSDYALDKGVQSALQSEAGAEVELPLQLSLSATGFYHRYTHLVFMELILDCEGNSDPIASFVRTGGARPTPLCARQGLPQGDGDAYGLELLLKRSLQERLSGWLSYTLAWADATAADGTDFVPQFDVRHVLNLVLKYDWFAGFDSGLRVHYRSGKPAVNTIYDFIVGRFERVDTRLPAFYRIDINVAYHWATSWGRLWLTLQWLNLTFSREATKRDCRLDITLEVKCTIDYQPAIVLPNAGVRAEF